MLNRTSFPLPTRFILFEKRAQHTFAPMSQDFYKLCYRWIGFVLEKKKKREDKTWAVTHYNAAKERETPLPTAVGDPGDHVFDHKVESQSRVLGIAPGSSTWNRKRDT